MKLILLVGQSNMAGRDVAQADDLAPVPGLKAFGKDGRWHEAIEPITKDRRFVGTFDSSGKKIESPDPWDNLILREGDKVYGVGPGKTFGRLLAEAMPNEEIGLIPTAVGGTPLSAWMPGGTDSADPSLHPYDDSIALARKARASGEIIAVLWHQGETDALKKNGNYEEELIEIIGRFRRDLELTEEIPFIMGELGTFYQPEIMDQVPFVNRAMANITRRVKNTGLVKADNLTHRGDFLHFDRASQHLLGERYFREFMRMTGKSLSRQ